MTMPSLTPHSFRPTPGAAARQTHAPWEAAPRRKPSTGRSSLRANRWWTAGLLLLFAITFAIRSRYFGNPFIDVDEQFYLLVGDRMLHGAVPYLDIWDRKPVGLFVLYAAIRALGGAGILQYQLVASAFAGATAVMIAIIARRISSPRAALIAGLAYIPALAMSGGAGGQTPVFYNLPMAVAAWLLIDMAMRAPDPAEVRWRGAGVMLLVGIAMQIKYSALFEGLYFGLALLALSWRAAPRRPAILLDGALWIALALLPTAIAFVYYAHIGEAQAFIYANFTSITQRGADPVRSTLADLRRVMVRLTPFLIAIILGEWLLRDHGTPWTRRRGGREGHLFAIGWLVAAFLGFAAFGSFYGHYALPLLVPLSILSAPTYTIVHRAAGRVMGALVLLVMFIAYPINAARLEKRHGDAAYAREISGVIAAHLHGRCPYIFYGEPILYQLTNACLPSRWAFPFHLNLTREAGALGVDPIAEATRIMDGRPPVVVDRLNDDADVNDAVQHLVRTRLARDYRLVYVHPNRARDPDIDQVWVLRTEA
jgi:4-amino-4-deoxy-L-arabinose transferase-like glycosyltransferase